MTTRIHWLRGTTVQDADSVIHWLATTLGESVVAGWVPFKGYSEAFRVGPVTVSTHATRPEMGVCVDITGGGCDELGAEVLESVFRSLELRVSRIDLAVDHCNFTPADLCSAWRSGDVRTRCKVPEGAREGRPWRKSGWRSEATGDTFTMGSRTSTLYGRCYDERGWTRFELEVKGSAAPIAALQVFEAVRAPEAFSLVVLSWVRRLVDFVDADSAVHPSRRTLLPFWEAFCGAVPKARAVLTAQVARSIEEVRAWVAHQVAPSLALVADVLGWDEVRRVAHEGRNRWKNRHREIRRSARLAMTP